MSVTTGPTGVQPTAAPPPQRRSRRWRRALVTVLVVLVALGLVVLAGGGWYFSGVIHSDALAVSPSQPAYDLVAAPAGADAVRVSAPTGVELPEVLTSDAVYALTWPGGRVVVTGVLDRGDGWVVRATDPRYSDRLATSTKVNDYREIWDQPSDIGISYRTVAVAGPDGPLPAWLVPGRGTPAGTWAVMVHGRGGNRAEPLRSLLTVHDVGMTALLVTYRNDVGAPSTADHMYGFGATEWPDLEAAVRYAADHGAQRVVLFGYSLGGAVVAAFLENSALASSVSGVVLDAPMLSLAQGVEYGASRRGLPVVGWPIPAPMTWTAMRLASLRYGTDWRAIDYVDSTAWVTVPVLVFHGGDDRTVPVSTSRALAAAEPDLVTLHVVPGAGHVESWNYDPASYATTLRAFLDSSLT